VTDKGSIKFLTKLENWGWLAGLSGHPSLFIGQFFLRMFLPLSADSAKKSYALAIIKCAATTLTVKMLGHYRYFGVSENSRGLRAYRYLVRRLVFKWINRRSQKRSMDWKQFDVYCLRHGFPQPKIYASLYEGPLAFEGING
jgi:hypothetical protein